MGQRVVARYRDGKLYKGTVSSFSPLRERFHLLTLQQRVLEIRTSELKAVFFVKSFVGNPSYNERKTFDVSLSTEPRIVCEFQDGEMLVGHSTSYDPEKPGFFVTPADPKSNNEKVYVVQTSARRVFRPQ
jgi:small nuclear ribonucleoprotein (snRNP)-like protein